MRTPIITEAQRAATSEFRIQSITRTSSTQVTLQWPATIGSVYQVQSSGNLAAGGWVNVGGEIHATATTITHPVVASPAQPQRFYRVVKTL